jgi:hypothetical protein
LNHDAVLRAAAGIGLVDRPDEALDQLLGDEQRGFPIEER